MIDLFHFLFLVLLVFLMGFIPGRILADFLPFSSQVRTAASFAISFFIYYLVGFATYLLKLPTLPIYLGLFLIFLVFFIIKAVKRKFTGYRLVARPAEYRLVGMFFILFLIVVSLQNLLPFYAGGFWYFDWFEHYQRALFFTDHLPLNFQFGPYLLTARPPFFNIVASYFQTVIGREFYHYQIIATLLNLVIFFPLYLLCRDFIKSGKFKHLLLLVFALTLLNPAIMQQATFTWTKSLSSYFILLGLYFYLSGRRKNHSLSFFLSFSLLAGGFLTHYSVVGYIIPVFLDFALISFIIFKNQLKRLIIGILIFLTISSTWFTFAFSNYGPYNSLLGNTSYEWTKNMTLSGRLKKDITNFTYTFLPIVSPDYLQYIKPQSSILVKIYDLAAYFYFDTIPGSVTLTLYVLVILSLSHALIKWIKQKNKFRENWPAFFSSSKYFFIFLTTLSIPLNLIIYPAETKVTASIIFYPLTLIIIAYGIARLIRVSQHLSLPFRLIITLTFLIEAILGVMLRVYILPIELNPEFNYKLTNPLLYNYQTLPVHLENWNLKVENNLIFLYDRFHYLQPLFFIVVISAWYASFIILKRIILAGSKKLDTSEEKAVVGNAVDKI